MYFSVPFSFVDLVERKKKRTRQMDKQLEKEKKIMWKGWNFKELFFCCALLMQPQPLQGKEKNRRIIILNYNELNIVSVL